MQAMVNLLDSTLRDGAQAEGISLSVEDKLSIVHRLDGLGISFIEAGNPGSNPKDLEFFRRAAQTTLHRAQLAAFGSTRRRNTAVEEDENVRALLAADTGIVVLFGKAWPLHVKDILCTTPEENLLMIEETCRFFCDRGRRVFFDAEHFFDGFRENSDFALSALSAAARGGAECIVLCDTNGGNFPTDIFEITKTVCEKFSLPIGIHAHDDAGMAVANTILGVQAGASHVQGTYLGFGERCGNASLATVIANLQLKLGVRCIPEENLPLLTDTARHIAEVCNVSLRHSQPYVGDSAFAHKAGMHIDGVLKNPVSFEHISPEAVGNGRKILLSEMSGRTALLQKISRLCPGLTKDSPKTADIMEELKHLELLGYQFEGADSSFELLVRKHTGTRIPFFRLVHYRVLSGNPSEPDCSASATVKVQVGDKLQLMAAEGNGPVNALDKALRKALEVFYPNLSSMRLIDYKVRVMDSKDATGATVRVLISSSDGASVWTTVGVSHDVVQASWIALADSVEYKLIKDKEREDR